MVEEGFEVARECSAVRVTIGRVAFEALLDDGDEVVRQLGDEL